MDVNDVVVMVDENENSILYLHICMIDEVVILNDEPIIIVDDSEESDGNDNNLVQKNNVIKQTDNEDDEEFIRKLLLCSICNINPNENDAVELPRCNHRFCKKCLSKYLKDIGLDQNGYKCPNSECGEEFEIDYWLVTSGVLEEEDYNKNSSFKLNQLVSEENVYYCPNTDCKCCFILEEGEIHNEITGETDNEGNVMNLEAIQHRDKYRVRCINTNWCIKCKVKPYHLGKTCEEYENSLKQRKCRYCKSILEDQESKCDICENNEECSKKRKRSCNRILECGHPCFGIKRCKCLPCLMPDCINNKTNKNKENINGITGDDYCNICWCESLSQSPCIQLECGHIFHYDCIMERLKYRWTSDRITFSYLNCPLCDKMISNPVISPKMKNDLSLMEIVKEKALEYLKIENMMNDKELTDPSSEYYNKPEEYGMKKFSFLLCEKCKKPYYAGLAACGGGEGEENGNEQQQNLRVNERRVDMEMIIKDLKVDDNRKLYNCRYKNAKIKPCDIHGFEYAVYKCRYCCSQSVWFCFGTTHFCDNCHNKHGELAKAPSDSLPKCLGKGKCPIGGNHPPNGVEHYLGCSVCLSNDLK